MAHAVVLWHTQILTASHRTSTDPSEPGAKQMIYYLSAGDASRPGRPLGVRVLEQQELLLVLRWQPRVVEIELKAAPDSGGHAREPLPVDIGALGVPRDAGGAAVSALPGVGKAGKKAAQDEALPVGFSSRIDFTERQQTERQQTERQQTERQQTERQQTERKGGGDREQASLLAAGAPVPAPKRMSSKNLLADAAAAGGGRNGDEDDEDDGEGKPPRTSVLDGATFEMVDEVG